jgi:DNA-binding IclR family transcriptional regulator
MTLSLKDSNAAPAPGSESARRVLDLLFAYTVDRHTLSSRELAAATGIPLPTVYRYVAFLRDLGLLLERGNGLYSLSARFMSLAQAAEAAERLIDLADPVMRRLAEDVDETVILVRLIAGAAVCVHRIEAAHHRLRISFEPGQALSLEGGASARLLLASLSPEARRAQLAELAARDPQRASWLETETELAAERGWAISTEEVDRGIWAASAAIRDRGKIIASLTVPSPLVRTDAPVQEQMLNRVRAAADEINAAIRATRPA